MSLVCVGAKDGEDGALLPRLGQQLVDIHLLLGELKVSPGLALIGAVSANNETWELLLLYCAVATRFLSSCLINHLVNSTDLQNIACFDHKFTASCKKYTVKNLNK